MFFLCFLLIIFNQMKIWRMNISCKSKKVYEILFVIKNKFFFRGLNIVYIYALFISIFITFFFGTLQYIIQYIILLINYISFLNLNNIQKFEIFSIIYDVLPCSKLSFCSKFISSKLYFFCNVQILNKINIHQNLLL